jgi:thioredoxin-related protein
MKLRPVLPAVILCLLAGLFLAPAARPAELILPQGLEALPYSEALSEAAAEKKTIMVYFWADWCPSCQKFNAETLPDKTVLKNLADSYKVVSVNTGSDPEKLAQQYRIRAIPAFVFLSSQGEPITVLPGAVDSEIFAMVLDYISSGSYANLEFEEFAKLKGR